MDKFTTEDALLLYRGLHDQYRRKNAAYGNSAHITFEAWGPTAYLVRISDKINRMNQLMAKPETDDIGESILDTIGDCITYLLMLLADLKARDYAVNGKTYESAIEDEFVRVESMDIDSIIGSADCSDITVQGLRTAWEESNMENDYKALRGLVSCLTTLYLVTRKCMYRV